MKKTALSIIFLLMIASLFSSCNSVKTTDEPAQSGAHARDYTDFFGKTIGVAMGSVSDLVTQNQMSAKPAYYSDMSAGIEDIRKGRIDAYMADLSTTNVIAAAKGNEDLESIEVSADFFKGPMGAIAINQDIIDRFNVFLGELQDDGTLSEMQTRWLEKVPDLDSPIPDIPLTGANGTLKIATCLETLPFAYLGTNGMYKGYSIELVLRFAQHEGMNVEFSEMEFSALVPYTISGKADLTIANISITEERKKSVLFTDPIYEDKLGILALKKDSVKTVAEETNERDYTYFANKKIGVVTGTVCDDIAVSINSVPAYYSEESAGIEDVRKARVDGFMTDMSSGRVIAALKGNEDLECIEIPAEYFSCPMGGFSINQDVISRFNVFLAKIKAEGTLADMQNRWLNNVPDLDALMPDIQLTGNNGTLKVAVCSTAMPFVYVGANNELKGYSIELVQRFAEHEGLNIEFADMDFSGLIPYIVSGKADFAIANVSITEERKKSVIFTDSIFDDQLGIVTLRSGAKTVETVENARDYTYFENKKIGVVTGTVCDDIAVSINSVPAYYSEESAGIEDVRKIRVDGFMTDMSTGRVMAALKGNEDLECIEIPAEYFSCPMGGFSVNQDVISRFNVFLAKIKAEGTLADMQNRWLNNVPDLDAPMPDIQLTGNNGTLKVAVCSTAMPFVYVGANNELKGYSIELVQRFAEHEGLNIEFADMDFSGLIPYIVSGKADFAIANVSITEERKKSVIFTDSIFDDQLGIVTLKTTGSETDNSYTNFTGKKFAVMAGSVFDEIADRVFTASEKLYFNNVIDEIQAVHKGKADAALLDHVVAMVNLSGGEYDDLTTTEVPLQELNFRYAVFSDKQEIIDKYNQFLKEIKSNGIYDDMEKRWFSDFDNTRKVPKIPLTDNNGTLRVAINASYPPFVYLGDNGEWSGFDIEQFYRFAEFLGMDIEFTDMEFGAMLPYVVSGKCDIASSIYYTDERAKSVIFGDIDYIGKTVLVHKKDIMVEKAAKTGFINWVKTGIDRNLITDNRWKMIVNGLSVTMIISLIAQIFGTIFGCFVCFVLMRRNKFVRWIGTLYCGLIHGTPIVVLLMITYYIIFGSSNISSVLIAISAFTMVEGAIIAQNLKGAIETVDPVEIEAARSIGFSAFRAFMTVTMPQAVRRALPSYTNGFVELVKATAIVGYIAIQDLTRAGDIIRSRTYDAYFPLLFVALIYLIVTTVCVQLFKFVIKKINGGVVQ